MIIEMNMYDIINQQKYILREDEIATGDNPVSIHITNHHTATLNLTEGKEVYSGKKVE